MAASEAKVGQLVLTHLSPRYAPGNRLTPNDLLNEAKAIFPNTLLAKDFLQIDINLAATVRDSLAKVPPRRERMFGCGFSVSLWRPQ